MSVKQSPDNYQRTHPPNTMRPSILWYILLSGISPIPESTTTQGGPDTGVYHGIKVSQTMVVYPDRGVHPDVGVYPEIELYSEIGMYTDIGVYTHMLENRDTKVYPDIREAHPYY
jgi:hypothetical protein